MCRSLSVKDLKDAVRTGYHILFRKGLTIDKEEWKQKQNIGVNLPPTRRSMMAMLGDTAYLFGGYNFDGVSGNASQGKIPNKDTYKLKLKECFIE